MGNKKRAMPAVDEFPMKGGEGRGGRMCQDQSIVHAGLLLLSSAPPPLPRYFSFSSTFAFFSFIGTAVFLAIAFLRSIDPTPDLTKPHLSQRNKRSSHACNVYRALFYAFNYTDLWLPFVRFLPLYIFVMDILIVKMH